MCKRNETLRKQTTETECDRKQDEQREREEEEAGHKPRKKQSITLPKPVTEQIIYHVKNKENSRKMSKRKKQCLHTQNQQKPGKPRGSVAWDCQRTITKN